MDMSKIAFIFPGQGAQKAGMGQEFYEKCPALFTSRAGQNDYAQGPGAHSRRKTGKYSDI